MLQAVLPSRKETLALRKPTCQRTRGVPHGSMRWVLIMLRCAKKKPRGGAAGCRILLKHKAHMDWNEIRPWDTRLCPQIVCGCIDGYMYIHAIYSIHQGSFQTILVWYTIIAISNMKVNVSSMDGILDFKWCNKHRMTPGITKFISWRKEQWLRSTPVDDYIVPKLYCFYLGSRSKPWNWVVPSEPQNNW